MSELALSLAGLGHAYRPDQWVFRGYNVTVCRGQVFALLGPNGCGKSTLLKAVLGLLRPSEGTVTVHGQTAFVPQLFQVSFDYSVLDIVLMGRARRIGLFAQPTAADHIAARVALERVGLAGHAEQPFRELSGGMRQLAVFARALVAEADILVLDEPTSALDLKNQSLILDWIARLSRSEGLTVIFTTHHPQHAIAVADEALLMLGKQDYACGPVRDVLTEERLESLYGVPLRRLVFDHAGRAIDAIVPVHLPHGGSRTE